MSKYLEENSKISEREVMDKMSPLMGETLPSQKSNKSKVMRVTKKEEDLILFLRENNIEQVTNQLKDILIYSSKNIDCSYLKKLISMLSHDEVLDIDLFLKNEFITMEQIGEILKAFDENKNIVITGQVASGKTTLMNILLNLQEKRNMVLSNRFNEFKLTANCIENNEVTILSKGISMEDISNPNYSKSLFVMDEMVHDSDILSMITILNTNKQVFITFMNDGVETDVRRLLSDRFYQDCKIKEYVKSNLNLHNFVVINISCKDGRRHIDKIEEI